MSRHSVDSNPLDVFSKNTQFVGQRSDSLDRLPVSYVGGESKVDIKPIFLLTTDNRQRLYLSEIDIIKR